jgi:hypothetical protein
MLVKYVFVKTKASLLGTLPYLISDSDSEQCTRIRNFLFISVPSHSIIKTMTLDSMLHTHNVLDTAVKLGRIQSRNSHSGNPVLRIC